MVRKGFTKDRRGRLVRVLEEALPEPIAEPVEEVLDLDTLTFNELKALCKEKGLSAKGKKAELIAKLSNSGDGDNEEASE
jgi:hypothetical protein|tara:strand:+ start:1268 stop:1507 length:240 start_codon:yes stop_codon:yes gene_type:complete